jgi:hypothetical protein
VTGTSTVAVPHVVRGRVLEPYGDDVVEYDGFVTPSLDLDELVWPRSEPGPAFDLPVDDIIEFLVLVGARLDLDTNEHLKHALEVSLPFSGLGPRVLAQAYRGLPAVFERASLEFQVDQEVGRAALDGWAEVRDPNGRVRRVRAFPPRLVQVLAGNTPGFTGITVARAALTKGVHLQKLPSNDLLTGTAILRTMAEVDPEHPVTQSFSCVYWRGGDTTIEGALYRAQFFDRLVAWGGDAAIRSALQYTAPGFDLVSFDPKVSISLLGREALASPAAIEESARAAAIDVGLFNQEVCAASRFIYAEAGHEGERGALAEWCATLAAELAVERAYADAQVPPPPSEVRSEVDVLRAMEPDYRVFGTDDGHGLVILSDEPVGFHPVGKTVNVVRVPSLDDALEYVNVATQTVGIYPGSRAVDLRDRLAARGMQRIVPLGDVIDVVPGVPHDGFLPLHRFLRWLVDDC